MSLEESQSLQLYLESLEQRRLQELQQDRNSSAAEIFTGMSHVSIQAFLDMSLQKATQILGQAATQDSLDS